MEDYLEDYFDLLLNQIEQELSYLPESTNFISTSTSTTNSNIANNNGNITRTLLTNNNVNVNICDDEDFGISIDDVIIEHQDDQVLDDDQAFKYPHQVNHQYHHNNVDRDHSHTNTILTINGNSNDYINIDHDAVDHMRNYESTTINPSIQQSKDDTVRVAETVTTKRSTQFIPTSTTITTATITDSYSSTSSLAKFNQRESSLSLNNYSRSSFYENNDEVSYNLLTASQIQRIIDHYKPLVRPNCNNHEESMENKWDRKGKKSNGTGNNNPTYTNLFGCDVNDIEKAYGGLILPPFIENALLYLVRYGINSVGIFRKSGVKSRIMTLRQKLESMTGSKSNKETITTSSTQSANNIKPTDHYAFSNGSGTASTLPRYDNLNHSGLGIESGSPTIKYRLSSSYAPGEEFCVYDVADMVKMWLREIKPRPLITKEVISVFKEMMQTNNNTSCSNNINDNNNINSNNNNSVINGPSPHELSLKLSVLLTDSQRAILEIFLHFLSLFAANSEINQMNSQNLAICFTPSLCECSSLTGGGGFGGVGGGFVNTVNNSSNVITNNSNNNFVNYNNNTNGLPFGSDNNNTFHVNGCLSSRSADTEIIFDAQRCLQYLIDNCSAISMIPSSLLPFSLFPTLSSLHGTMTGTVFPSNPVNGSLTTNPLPVKTRVGGINPVNHSNQINPQPMDTSPTIDGQPSSNHSTENQSFDDVDNLSSLMPSLSLVSPNGDTNCNNKPTSNGLPLHHSPSTSSLINGGNLLPSTYESRISINAAPIDILKRILYQRNLFDPTVVEWRIVKQSPPENCDIFEYKVQSSFFLPLKTFTIERKWSFIDNSPLLESSPSRSFYSSLKKSKPNKTSFKGIVLRETGYLYDSWWKISTHGEGKCQLDVSIAVDLRGHSYYWYTNTFPSIIDWQLYQIKQSFLVDFIETKNFKSTTV